MLARRHHYISQFYLKNFTANRSKPRLRVVDIRQHISFFSKPEKVALERDFHTVSIAGQQSDIVETALARVEHEVAPAAARIIATKSLKNGEDALLLWFFVTMLIVKNPRGRDTFNALAHKLVTTIGKGQGSDPKVFESIVRRQIAEGDMPANIDIEKLRQAILSDSYKVSMSTEAHLDAEFSNIPELIQFVAGRRWVLQHSTDDPFVTCDYPVVLRWADPARNSPIGLGLRETRLLFPISSELAVCGGFELSDQVIEVNAQDVAVFNGHVIANANRQVYARDDSFQYILPNADTTRSGKDLKTDDQIPAKARAIIYDGGIREVI